jgi:hypothetical protein
MVTLGGFCFSFFSILEICRPQIEFLGTESVYQHFKQLYLAFDDFEVQIISGDSARKPNVDQK